MTPEEQKFYAAKLEWMRTAVPSDGTLELSDGRKLDLFLARAEGKVQSATKYLGELLQIKSCTKLGISSAVRLRSI